MADMPLEVQRELAARLFPAAWIAANAETVGKRRRSRTAALRGRAVAESIMSPLRKQGASCGSCREYRSGPTGVKGKVCDYHLDGGAYSITKATDLCPDWSARP